MKPGIGVVGLGIMGSAIAANLLRRGFAVGGFDPDPAAQARLRAAGGQPLESPAALADRAGIVITSLPAATALDATVAGLTGAAGLIVVECSTLALDDKERARAVLSGAGAILLDCPLSGTGAQAVTGDLVLFGSGDADAFARARPALAAFTRSAPHLGTFGNGTRMKFIANLLVAIHNVATAEALVLGEMAGLDVQLVFDTIADSAATSRMFQVRGPSMVADDYPPMIRADLFAKDLKLIGEFAAALGAATPLFSAGLPIYDAVLAQGMGDRDTAAVCRVLEGMAGHRRHDASPTPNPLQAGASA